MQRRPTKQLVLSALAAVVFACVASIAEACPTCKEAIAGTDPRQAGMVKGYFYSIIFMMSMPFIILGTFGSFAWWTIRRAKADDASVDQLDDDASQ